MTTPVLGETISPGVWGALMTITLYGTTTREHPSMFPHPEEWECTWTGLQALCPFIRCPLTDSDTSTPSAPPSLSLSSLLSGLNLGSWTPLCPCVRFKKRGRNWRNSSWKMHFSGQNLVANLKQSCMPFCAFNTQWQATHCQAWAHSLREAAQYNHSLTYCPLTSTSWSSWGQGSFS